MKKSKKRDSSDFEQVNRSDDLEAGRRPTAGPSRSGTITQQLDMNESGPLRGEEILRNHGRPDPRDVLEQGDRDPLPLSADRMEHNYNVDMSEDGREGDEESGDEHSSGLQGSDRQELQIDDEGPDHADAGYPGDMTEKVAKLDPTRRGYRRRAG